MYSFAPWCPACKQFSATWEQFAEWADDEREELQVGKVDVTAETSKALLNMCTVVVSIKH